MGKQVKKHGYSCKLVRVVDGDTCDAMIDLGFDVWVKNRIRFYGVDTWESRTRDLEEKEKGLAAKAFTKDLLENSDEGKFSIISHGKGKYGRVLGELFVKGHEKSVNELLKENSVHFEEIGKVTTDNLSYNNVLKISIEDLNKIYTNWLSNYMVN